MKRFRLSAPRIKLSENDVERQCLDLLRLRGYYPLRLQSGLFKTKDDRHVRVGEPGLADYVVLHRTFPGFLMEVKRPGGKLSTVQEKKFFEVQTNSIAWCAVDSYEYLMRWLYAHEKSKAGNSNPGL